MKFTNIKSKNTVHGGIIYLDPFATEERIELPNLTITYLDAIFDTVDKKSMEDSPYVAFSQLGLSFFLMIPTGIAFRVYAIRAWKSTKFMDQAIDWRTIVTNEQIEAMNINSLYDFISNIEIMFF